MAIKRITLHAGHNPSGRIACGASDYLDESTEARLLVKKIKAIKGKGKIVGCTVNNGTSQSDVLRKIVAKCNAASRELDVSIHFNACRHETKDGKVKGCEICVYNLNGPAVPIAKKILKRMETLGFTNRGVVERKNLAVLKTNKPAMLIEVCFVDDYDDAALYKKKKNQVAKAIYDSIFE